VEELRRIGAEVLIFNPVHHYVNRLYFNYRDHRKIACIDGDTAYTGGANIADEYANLMERFGYWKDDGIRLEGQLIALAAWMRRTYGSTMNQALKTVLPVKQKVREAPKRKIHLLVDALTLEAAIQTAERKKYKARLRLLYALKENPDLPYENTLHKLNLTAAAR
jgi:phosphatidylserine/phosphatidylglycerophosphate/cardiolipin synthase-like enzyme